MVALGGLTPRERMTLSAIERRLTNTEIAEEFGISVRTVESHIAALRRKLDAESRTGLIRAARELRGASIPVPNTSFVGREQQTSEVRGLLERTRWVTVVGPAGTGKTRLGLEVAVADERAAVLVELEHATSDEVPAAIAKAVGVSADSHRDPVVAVGVALSVRPHLVVLDNADRVGPAARTLARRLLAAAPELVVLVTSRAPLGDGAETVYGLAPLDTSGPHSAACRLFVDRMQAAAPGATLSDDDLAAVERVCQRLDGLPLAIELAAARVRHLAVPELETRLAEGFGALERDGAGRHDTLGAAFAWTWNLLDDDERAVLYQLAALPRTFDLDLADAVTSPGTTPVVLRLLDRSLITPTLMTNSAPSERLAQSPPRAPAEPRRFRILDVIRHFTLARTPVEVIEQTRDAHVRYHAIQAVALAARARVDDSSEANAVASQLCPEVSAALAWALARQSDMALPLARAIAIGVEQYGPDSASIEALALAARDNQVRATATSADLCWLGQALCYHDLDLVNELAEVALERIDSPQAELAAHFLAGLCAAYRDQQNEALTHLAIAERLAIQLDDHWHLGSVLMAAGIANSNDNPTSALDAFQAAMDAFALAGDAMHVNNARYMIARSADQAGRPVHEVFAWAQQCVDYASKKGNAHELAHALLARAPAQPGRDAERDLTAAAATFQSVGDLRCLTRSSLALAAIHTGDQRRTHLSQALDVAERLHDHHLEAKARARLVSALWEDGDQHTAAVEYGILTERAGDDIATELCPPQVIDGVATLPAAVAEGRARATSWHHRSVTESVG